MSDRRRIKSKHGRRIWTPLRGFWQAPQTLDEADPEIQNLPLLAAAVAGDVDISGAVLEGSDAVAGTIAVAVSLSGAVLEGSDAVAGTIAVAVNVSGAVTEGSDAVAGTIEVLVLVSGAVLEGSDAADGTLEVEAVPVPVPVSGGGGGGGIIYYQGKRKRRKTDELFDSIEKSLKEQVYGVPGTAETSEHASAPAQAPGPAIDSSQGIEAALRELTRVARGDADLSVRLAAIRKEVAEHERREREASETEDDDELMLFH